MKTASQYGRFIALSVLSITLGLSSVAAHAASVSSNVSARIGNTSGAIYIDNDISGYLHTLPSDSIFSSAALAMHYGDGTHVVNLANSAIGIAGNWSGTSIYGEPNRTAVGGGAMQFRDEILVQSNTLAINTPVTVEFAFFAASARSIQHTNPDPNFGSKNLSVIDLNFGGSIRSSVMSANDIFISSGDHRDFEWLGSSTIKNGVLDPAGNPLLTLGFTALVGETISLAIDIEASASGAANPTSPSSVHHGNAYAALALAFGATPMPASGDVTLISTAFGGAFPDSSAASLANAQTALIAPVPLPGAFYLLLGCLGVLAKSRRGLVSLIR